MSLLILGGEGAVHREAARLLAGRGKELHVLPAAGDVRRAARERRVRRGVLVSSLAADRAPRLPQHRDAAAFRKELEASGLPFTVLLPAPLYQEDLPHLETIVVRGVYPLPICPRGVSRVDARDVAEAVARALLEPGHEGRAYPLVGPEALSGGDVAAVYAHILNREVRYAGGEPACPDLRARCGDFALQEKLLRRGPRPLGMFVHDVLRGGRAGIPS